MSKTDKQPAAAVAPVVSEVPGTLETVDPEKWTHEEKLVIAEARERVAKGMPKVDAIALALNKLPNRSHSAILQQLTAKPK